METTGTEIVVKEEEKELDLEASKKLTDLTIERAQYWAQKLMTLVDRCNMSIEHRDGKKYLMVEAWQLIGEFANVTAVPDPAEEWKGEDGVLIGYRVHVKLLKNGVVVGGGDSSCGLDAMPCRGKTGTDRNRAAASAAQTWATSKAFRNRFSYVAKLGGYESTTAEEMTHDDQPRPKAPTPPNPTPKSLHKHLFVRGLCACGHKLGDFRPPTTKPIGPELPSDWAPERFKPEPEEDL